jgi:hypothetical protein
MSPGKVIREITVTWEETWTVEIRPGVEPAPDGGEDQPIPAIKRIKKPKEPKLAQKPRKPRSPRRKKK